LLGGHTATLHEGRVTQFGPTIDVYNQPVDLSTAQTFSDPPLNTLDVQLTGGLLNDGKGHHLGALTAAPSLSDGSYTMAFRPHHASLTKTGVYQIAIEGVINTSEITGSETYIHISVGDNHWVVLTHGVHQVHAGEAITLYLNPSRYYLFSSAEGLLVQSPGAPAEAA